MDSPGDALPISWKGLVDVHGPTENRSRLVMAQDITNDQYQRAHNNKSEGLNKTDRNSVWATPRTLQNLQLQSYILQ